VARRNRDDRSRRHAETLQMRSDLGVAQPRQQIVDACRDQQMRIEDLGGVLLSDVDHLGQRLCGARVILAIGEEGGHQADRDRQQDGADQQQPQRRDRPQRLARIRRRGVRRSRGCLWSIGRIGHDFARNHRHFRSRRPADSAIVTIAAARRSISAAERARQRGRIG